MPAGQAVVLAVEDWAMGPAGPDAAELAAGLPAGLLGHSALAPSSVAVQHGPHHSHFQASRAVPMMKALAGNETPAPCFPSMAAALGQWSLAHG